MNDWIFLASYLHTFEAHLSQTLLKDAGIETIMENEFTVGVYDGISNALGGVRLMVKKDDFETARQLLSETAEILEK